MSDQLRRKDRASPVGVAFALLLAAIVPALGTAWLHPKRPDWSRRSLAAVTLSDVRSWPIAPLWIDVRPAEDFHRAHLPGAISLPAGASWEDGLATLISTWAPPQRIVVYCESRYCPAGRDVAERLRRELGEPVVVLKEAWTGEREIRR